MSIQSADSLVIPPTTPDERAAATRYVCANVPEADHPDVLGMLGLVDA